MRVGVSERGVRDGVRDGVRVCVCQTCERRWLIR